MPNLPGPLGRRSALAVWLALPLTLAAASPAPELPAPAVGLVDRPLTLPECLQLASERQPAIAAARARLFVSEAKLRALDALCAPGVFLNRDLPVRRRQAALGVEINRAGLGRAERDTSYAVVRAYFTVQYARAQKHIADDMITDLKTLHRRIAAAVAKRERPAWSAATLDLILLYLRKAEARQAEAEHGIDAATAALREAIGLGPGVCLRVAEQPLPNPSVQACREEVVAAALALRSDLRQSEVASEVVQMEAEAQGRVKRPGAVRTFASGADIHARQVPQPFYGVEYRPGGVPLAVSTVLAGRRTDRVETAEGYGAEAAAVAEKTRTLIALEAEEAYYAWREWSRKVALYQEAATIGERLAEVMREDVRGPLKKVIENLLPESLLAAQARADYNEALFRLVVALADLERITAGGFHAGLVAPPASK